MLSKNRHWQICLFLDNNPSAYFAEIIYNLQLGQRDRWKEKIILVCDHLLMLPLLVNIPNQNITTTDFPYVFFHICHMVFVIAMINSRFKGQLLQTRVSNNDRQIITAYDTPVLDNRCCLQKSSIWSYYLRQPGFLLVIIWTGPISACSAWRCYKYNNWDIHSKSIKGPILRKVSLFDPRKKSYKRAEMVFLH